MSKCIWYYYRHHRHHHHRSHHHRHHHHEPRPKAHTYAQNSWEASSRFGWNIWVTDLLSPRSNCIPFLQNLSLQLSTPWLWGIVRFRLSGHIRFRLWYRLTSWFRPLATRHLPPAACHTHTPPTKHCSTSLWIEHVGAHLAGVEFSTGSFWLIENSEFVEALANRTLQVYESFGL